MFRHPRISIALILLVFAAILQSWSGPSSPRREGFHHTRGGGAPDSLFEGSNSLFATAGTCDHCHGSDPAGLASTDLFGNDVNVVDDWAASLMANSARDPFWRAKVSHEVAVNPHLQQEIESFCMRCHAPLGFFDAVHNGQNHFSMEQLHADPVALDGVSCLACHQQLPVEGIALHSGRLAFSSAPVAFGPFESPLVTPMALYSGVIPEHGPHVTEAEFCAGCHSLLTHTVNLEGNLTGGDFVEQATWHEWLNSSYPQNGTTCQSCHLPRLNKQGIVLAAGYNTPAREPFGLHTLAGGNALMLAILRDHREELGIFASTAQFDSAIQSTLRNLQQQSLLLEPQVLQRTADSVKVRVNLQNITGHKLPSGYPARKMSVHVTLRDESGNELFQSGGFDDAYFINGEDLPFEPHHQLINTADKVQIYEMVMGDVNGNRTTVLGRGAMHLKDNRLVPIGFSASHPQYDSTAIHLTGTSDPDFNFNSSEGSGTDDIYYHMSTGGYAGPVTVEVGVYYQSLPPTWMDEIFAISTPEINTWQQMYSAADRTPVLMRSAELFIPAYVGIGESGAASFHAWIAGDDVRVRVAHKGIVSLYDVQGKLLLRQSCAPGEHRLRVPETCGALIIVFTSESGQQEVRKLLKRNF